MQACEQVVLLSIVFPPRLMTMDANPYDYRDLGEENDMQGVEDGSLVVVAAAMWAEPAPVPAGPVDPVQYRTDRPAHVPPEKGVKVPSDCPHDGCSMTFGTQSRLKEVNVLVLSTQCPVLIMG